MARPIKETPILYGKDAKRFEDNIKHNSEMRVSKSEYDRVMENYHIFNKIKVRPNK